jgi:cysteine dioxygenase
MTLVEEPSFAKQQLGAHSIPKSLDHLIELIHQELGTDKGLGHVDIDVAKIQALMTSYESNEQDWEKFALW